MGGTPLGAYCRSGQLSLKTGRSVSDVTISLREITEDNIDSVQSLRTTPDQQRFVTTVVDSLAEAVEVPQANPWFRAVYADERPVGS